jgi:cell growth-regulating nucleolar protein
MSEEQKYQGALYKPKKQKSSHIESQPQESVPVTPGPAKENKATKRMSQQAYVEDITERYEAYREYEIHSDDEDTKSTADLPEAPTPPPAVEEHVDVFKFLVKGTPTASNMTLPDGTALSEDTQLVRYDKDKDTYVDQAGYMVDDEDIHYGTGPVPPAGVRFQTPATKVDRRKAKDSDIKKDKKRKRLHIDTHSPQATDHGPGDQVMTDAPAELHSGLTGGLDRLMRRPSVFPPSPDYSGGDNAERSPASPIKKSKHTKASKPSRVESIGNNLKALVSGSKTTKVSKKRKHSSEKKEKKRHHRSDGEKAPKLIEYRPSTSDGKEGEGQVILYKPRSELFLSMCTKGPDSERGYSMNKALKRFHRERTSSGTNLGKIMEEKELWRSLRMRRNDRGEIVLFSVDDDE